MTIRVKSLLAFILAYTISYTVLYLSYWKIGLLHSGLLPSFGIFLAGILSVTGLFRKLSGVLVCGMIYFSQMVIYLDAVYGLSPSELVQLRLDTVFSMSLRPLLIILVSAISGVACFFLISRLIGLKILWRK